MFLAVRIHFGPGGLLAERQPFTSLRMKILTQTGEFVTGGDTIQSQVSCTLAKSMARDGLTFGIIITDRQMFLKILFGVSEIVLRRGCKHGRQYGSTGHFCVSGSWRKKPDGHSA